MNKEDLVQQGVALKNQQRFADAEQRYRLALKSDPNYVPALGNLGVVLRLQGKPADAVVCYRRLIALEPGMAQGHYSLGNALGDLGDHAGAIACYERTIALAPGHVEAIVNLAVALLTVGRTTDAVSAASAAIQRGARFALAFRVLGDACTKGGRIADGVAAYRQAVDLDPRDPGSNMALANALSALGEGDDALSYYARAIELEPANASHFDAYLLALTYAGVPEQDWFAAHREFDRRFGGPRPTPSTRTKQAGDAGRKLRIGYVSGDLTQHAVANFIWPVLKAHDRQQFEISCYFSGPAADRATALFVDVVDHWRHVHELDTEALCAQIAADRIDILVDLASHTAYNRLDIFARRPAPVQCTWMGYAATTGLSAIDYRITDAWLDPPGTSEWAHSETLARLPNYSLCFEPSPVCPEPGPLPASRRGALTFGALNNSAKLNARTIGVWAEILKAIPQAQLLIYLKGSSDPAVAARLRERFARLGVAGERVEPFDRLSFAEYLEVHHRVDVALDPLGFSGVTTSFYALWMGVPTLTLPESLPISRGTAAIESQLGLENFIATDPTDYIAKAVALASGPSAALAEIRAALRERLRNSPLLDAPEFTRQLENLYRRIWRGDIGEPSPPESTPSPEDPERPQ